MTMSKNNPSIIGRSPRGCSPRGCSPRGCSPRSFPRSVLQGVQELFQVHTVPSNSFRRLQSTPLRAEGSESNQTDTQARANLSSMALAAPLVDDICPPGQAPVGRVCSSRRGARFSLLGQTIVILGAVVLALKMAMAFDASCGK